MSIPLALKSNTCKSTKCDVVISDSACKSLSVLEISPTAISLAGN